MRLIISYCGGNVWWLVSLSVALNHKERWLYGITGGSGGYMEAVALWNHWGGRRQPVPR